jgi:acetyltransferase-like isoleucine patch superfamily enzyme
VVLKGSRIGDNSIIGAGSVVKGTIPANCLAAGNPAQVISVLGPDRDGEKLKALD